MGIDLVRTVIKRMSSGNFSWESFNSVSTPGLSLRLVTGSRSKKFLSNGI